MPAEKLLKVLADGEFHSGQALAQQFDVSRTAIWKQVARLEHMGVTIEAVRGLGYRIPGGLDLLDEQGISEGLAPGARALLAEIKVHRSIDSTNAELLRAGALPGGARVALAERQTAGRGRRGKAWISPFASSIYLSVAWRFDGGAEALEGLSLAIGVIACEVLQDLGVRGAALKWPNDILLDGAKLAGILVEMQGDASGPCAVVIGIGINVTLPAAAATGIGQAWADLSGRIAGYKRDDIAAALLNRILPALCAYESTGFQPWHGRWNELDAYAGLPVAIDNAGRKLAGTAAGVDERGALIVQTPTGEQRLHGGEVSLRPSAGTET